MITFGLQKAFDWYKRDRRSVPLKRTLYTQLLREFFKFLRDQLLDEGIKLVMPYKLGTLQVVGVKDKPKVMKNGKLSGVAINWQETRKLWEEKPELRNKEFVYYTNTHTDGYRFKFFWSKKNVPYNAKKLYVFKLSVKNKKRIYQNIISGKHKYELT